MVAEPTAVLLVEDNPGDARLVRLLLDEVAGNGYTVTQVGSVRDALPHVESRRADIVLLDLGLPDSQGLDTVLRIRGAGAHVPIVILTGFDDELLAMQALQAGAQDYLVKGQIASDLVARSIRYAVQRQKLQAEADHMREQQLRLKDEFLSHVSHELRSPLTAVYQLVTVVHDGLAGALNDEQSAYLDVVVRNVKQLASMIDDLLEVTRAESGQLSVEPRCMAAERVIADALATLRARAAAGGISLSSLVPADLPLVHADPKRVQQVLINLLDNAIKFTPAAGSISVTAVPGVDEPDTVTISVSDSGCGIAPEHREQVFSRLYRADGASQAGRSGLGLGLYICRQIVQRQGGRIWLENDSGPGTTISFTLPVFSLRSEVVRLLAEHEDAPLSLALITIQLEGPRHVLRGDITRARMRELRSVVQRCLLPDLDLLLPPLSGPAQHEQCVVLVRADERGVEVLCNRLRQQLARVEALQDAAWTLRADTVRGAGSGESLEACISNIEKLLCHVTEEG